MALEIQDPIFRVQAVLGILRHWPVSQMVAGLAAVRRLETSTDRAHAIAEVSPRLRIVDWPQALVIVYGLGDPKAEARALATMI